MERNWRVKGLEGSWNLSRKNLKPGEPDGRSLQVLGKKASMRGGSSGRTKREGEASNGKAIPWPRLIGEIRKGEDLEMTVRFQGRHQGFQCYP